MSVIVKNLKHIYSKNGPFERIAIQNVSFEINDGEFVGIIGHTGSGKSTLIQHLNGLLKPDEGTIIVNGVDITAPGADMKKIRSQVGIVFQYPEYQLFEETVYKDIAYGPKNIGFDDIQTDLLIHDSIRLVGLSEDILQKSPFELSGGQKRRVAIAGVVAMRPEVLILDEPTAGLDPKAHKDVLTMVEEVHRRTGNITILVSHNMADIARLCDKVVVIDSGRLVTAGTPYEVFSKKGELRAVGLELPPVTAFTETLRERGVDLEATILDTDTAAEQIAAYLKRKAK